MGRSSRNKRLWPSPTSTAKTGSSRRRSPIITEEELALFDLLYKPPLRKATRERLKFASKSLLESVKRIIASLERWTEKEQTKALVEAGILDHLFQVLPSPPFTDEEKQAVAKKVHEHVWQQSASGSFAAAAA